MLIERFIKKQITRDLKAGGKAVVLYGARQTGKTTLVNRVLGDLGEHKGKILKINADEERFNEVLESRDSNQFKELIADNEVLFIDEAQRIENIGINLKIIIDTFPKLKIIVTGSSSFELANRVQEPLTGRKVTYKLFPIAQLELKKQFSRFELKDQIEERLIYGAYPEIFKIKGQKNKNRYLHELTRDYLYKDALEIVEVKNAKKIKDLLKLLAFQIGSNTSYNQLADSLDLSKETVERYLDILEKSFVIFRLTGFSRNLRKEITKTPKYYFYDLGIRNSLIDNLNPLNQRDFKEAGKLWENFLVIERLKRNNYLNDFSSSYFWRTYTGSEIDYVEEKEDRLFGFEFKYSKKKAKAPESFIETYKNSFFKLINRENFLNFVL
jgi:hypothetical protein